MAELAAHYRVRRSFSVIAHSPDIVELRRGVWNPVSITLSDKSACGKLFRVLELMTGEQSLEAIAAAAQLSEREALDLVSFLERHHTVDAGPASAFDSFVDVTGGTLADAARSQPDIDRAIVMGDADLVEEIARQHGDGPAAVRFERAGSDRVAALASADFTLSEDPLELDEQLAAYRDWQGGALVTALMTVDPILLRNLNRVALHHRIPWVHAAVDGPFLIVGPTFLPRRSPCYECFETRVSLSMRESDSYVRYKAALARRAVRVGTPDIARPFRALLASLATLELSNLVVTGSNFTIGKALSVYLPALSFSFNEVLRAPGCPACSPISEQHEQSPYFDLRGYVNYLYAGSGGDRPAARTEEQIGV